MYDIAVIGAGPAGLMAAHTAAAKGLKTVVIEKQPDVSLLERQVPVETQKQIGKLRFVEITQIQSDLSE